MDEEVGGEWGAGLILQTAREEHIFLLHHVSGTSTSLNDQAETSGKASLAIYYVIILDIKDQVQSHNS